MMMMVGYKLRASENVLAARASAPPTALRPAEAAATASAAPLLQLQRQYGNRHVQTLIQPKLAVTPPDDQYEQEADRVAGQVMRQIAAPQGESVQRQAQQAPTTPLMR